MFRNINPNYAIMYSTILWGTWWYPLRLLNQYGDNNAMPIVTSFLIATILLFIISYKKIRLFSKKNALTGKPIIDGARIKLCMSVTS